VTCARKPLADFVVECAPLKVEVTDPSLLIRINRLFRYGINANDLYEATRGVWVIGARRTRARFAMAVYAGIVREVYEIETWHPAGSTPYTTRDTASLRQDGRWEFLAHVAPDPIRSGYLGRSVEHYFRAGQQNPVVGVALT
jgi:hypothetical protein